MLRKLKRYTDYPGQVKLTLLTLVWMFAVLQDVRKTEEASGGGNNYLKL